MIDAHPKRETKPMPFFPALQAACAALILALTPGLAAAQEVRAYGPGGPLPAMREAAEAFRRETGVKVEVTAGPTAAWLARAKADADLIFSGSETMMTDFIWAMEGAVVEDSVTPLYLRPAAILVRPGNPQRIGGIRDLLRPGRRILVVNGAGQNVLWEDVVGRLADIEAVRAFRRNIVLQARNSAEARQRWIDDPSIEAWLIWNIWQVANPQLADAVPVEPDLVTYRDTGIGLTKRGADNAAARRFVEFLLSDRGAAIFRRWGWVDRAVSTP